MRPKKSPIPPEALDSLARGPREDGNNYWDFTKSAKGPSSAFWHWERTDAEGRFELPGLADRGYRLKLMDAATLQVHTSRRIRLVDGRLLFGFRRHGHRNGVLLSHFAGFHELDLLGPLGGFDFTGGLHPRLGTHRNSARLVSRRIRLGL